MNVDEFIAHHGTKGMKWGVRKRRNEAARAKKFNPSDDAKKAAEIRTKAKAGTVKSLSNDEIRTFTNRVNLERQFSAATPSNAKKVLNVVKDILGVKSTMDQVANFSNSSSGQAIASGFKKRKKAA